MVVKQYSMNVCKCNLDVHSSCCHYHVNYSISHIDSMLFTNHLPWSHGIVKCPLDLLFNLGTFYLLFYEYCEFGHSALFTYCFSTTI